MKSKLELSDPGKDEPERRAMREGQKLPAVKPLQRAARETLKEKSPVNRLSEAVVKRAFGVNGGRVLSLRGFRMGRAAGTPLV